jgi:hypothetical protein
MRVVLVTGGLLALLVMGWCLATADAATYYVDASGHDTNPGTQAQPFASIAQAARVALTPGDEVMVNRGTYPAPILIAGAGTPQAPIWFHSATPGAAVITGYLQPLDWPGDHASHVPSQQPHIKVSGFNFSGGPSDFQLRAGDGWIIEENSFTGCGQNGANIRGNEVTLQRNSFTDLQGHAFVIAGCTNCQVLRNVWSRINSAGLSYPANSAVTKILDTEGLLVYSNEAWDNVGAGLWLDWNNRNYRILGNHFSHHQGLTATWQGPGIWVEMSQGPGVISGNYLVDNTGAQLGILESPHVTVTGNTIRGGYACVEFRNLDRGSPEYRIGDETVQHNWMNCPAAFYYSAGVWTPAPEGMILAPNTINWLRVLGNTETP